MDKTIVYNGSTLFYRSLGPETGSTAIPQASSLTPLVLLHGFADDGAVWDLQAAALKKEHRLLIPDLPGSGRSSPLTEETSMEALADTVAALLDAENVGQAILVGHSMSGYITLAFAERHPGRLRAFGLFHSTAYPDSDEKKAARKKSIGFIRSNGARAFIRQTSPNLFAEGTRRDHPGIVEELIGRTANFSPDSLVYYSQAMIERPDRTEILKKTTNPVLFVIGALDPLIPPEISLRQAHMPGFSYIHILQQSGHMGMLEEPEKAARILDGFLQQTR